MSNESGLSKPGEEEEEAQLEDSSPFSMFSDAAKQKGEKQQLELRLSLFVFLS